MLRPYTAPGIIGRFILVILTDLSPPPPVKKAGGALREGSTGHAKTPDQETLKTYLPLRSTSTVSVNSFHRKGSVSMLP